MTALLSQILATSMNRPGPQSLTLVLQAFKNNGGFDATKQILNILRGVSSSEDSSKSAFNL